MERSVGMKGYVISFKVVLHVSIKQIKHIAKQSNMSIHINVEDGKPMCDSNTTYASHSDIYLEDTDSTEGWVFDHTPFTCLPRPRRPRFDYLMWLRYSYKNFKLLIQLKHESEIDQGIWLPKWTLRSKNSFV